MKKLVPLLCLLGLTLTLSAQTNTPPAPASLPDTILGYFSSFDTNLVTFENRFDLWTGASSIQGAATPLVNDIGLSYDLYHSSTTNRGSGHIAFDLENTIRNSGVAGSVISEQGGLGFNVIVWDTKLTLYGNGGYFLDRGESHKVYGEVGLRAKKGIGQHFYLGVGVGAQFPLSRQIYSAFTGVTF